MEIPWEVIQEAGPAAVPSFLVAAFVYAILTGRLVPASVVKSKDQDKNLWRETALQREHNVKTAIEAVEEANESSRVILAIVQELRDEDDNGN